MKKFIFCLFITVSTVGYGQQAELKKGVLKTAIGYEIKEKDQIQIGNGSNVDGSFNFIAEKEKGGFLKAVGTVAKVVGKVGLTATGLGGVSGIITNGLASLTGGNVSGDLINSLVGSVGSKSKGGNVLMSAFNSLTGSDSKNSKENETKNEIANLAMMLATDTGKSKVTGSINGNWATVLDIEETQNSKTGKAYIATVKIDGDKYEIDLDKAMLFGEVIVPSGFNFVTIQQKIADEKKKKEEEELAIKKKKEEEELAVKKKKEEEEAAARALQLQIQQQQQALLQQMQAQAQQLQAQQLQAQQQQQYQQQYQQPVQQYQQPVQQYQQPVQQYQQPVQQYQQPVQQYQQPVQQYQQPVQQYQQPVQQYQQPVQQYQQQS